MSLLSWSHRASGSRYESFWYTTVNRSISGMVAKVFKMYSAQGDDNADFSTLLANCR